MAVKGFVTPNLSSGYVNLRTGPMQQAAAVGRLKVGIKLELVAQECDWHACRVYVSKQVARIVDDVFVAMIPAAGRDWVNIRLAPNLQDPSTDVGDLRADQRLDLIEQTGDWLAARVYVSASYTRVVGEGTVDDAPIADSFSPPIGTPQEHAAWFAQATADWRDWPGRWFDANRYGNRYQLWDNGPWAYHTGADLNLPRQGNVQIDFGQPCYAPANGVVRAARRIPNRTWGNLIVIEHRLPDGTRRWSRLAHLLDMEVIEGQAVLRGQRLGHVGDACGRFPSHLHFDIAQIDLGRPRQPGQPDPAGDWPGDGEAARQRVANDYLDPREFILRLQP